MVRPANEMTRLMLLLLHSPTPMCRSALLDRWHTLTLAHHVGREATLVLAVETVARHGVGALLAGNAALDALVGEGRRQSALLCSDILHSSG
jgi:hypothetical protein